MRFAIFCLAVSLAAVCAGVEAGVYPPARHLQKRDIDLTNWQNQPDQTSGRTSVKVIYLPGQQPIQPVQILPTTTADPMCPEGNSGPCRELPLGQDGSIQVRCDGWVTLQFFVEYKVRGQKITKESRPFTWTLKRTIDIPSDATDIKLTVQGIGLFGATSDILKKQWKYPVIRCYSSIDAQNVNKVGCH